MIFRSLLLSLRSWGFGGTPPKRPRPSMVSRAQRHRRRTGGGGPPHPRPSGDIRGLLADRGGPGLRDLALFSTAVDTMLHGQDLLSLVVGDVQRRDGSMRPVIEVARARGMPPVRCALSNASTRALKKWITASGKKRTDYLFPGRGVEGRHPMGQRQLNRLLKLWVVEAGLDPSDYSIESLRRTKSLHILKGTGDLQTVRALLGHARIESTARYLGLETKADPIEVCRAFDL